MASTKALAEVPRINLSKENMERGTSGWASTARAVRNALEEHGFFEAAYNEIEPKAHRDLHRTLEELFNLDLDTKRRFTTDVPLAGYTLREHSLFESMTVPYASDLRSIESFVRCLFPQGNAQICEAIHLFVVKLMELEKGVRRMVFESYGVEGHFEEQERSVHYSVRLMRYRAGKTKKLDPPHYDRDLITILHEFGANGCLRVKTGTGDWVCPTLSGSSFLVMAGEWLMGWSNGRIRCPLHQVKMSEDNKDPIRYSVRLFSIQDDGTVNIPSELVDEKHPLKFKPFSRAALIPIYHKEMAIAAAKDQEYDGSDIVPTITKHYAI